jgi:hypothetical protein
MIQGPLDQISFRSERDRLDSASLGASSLIFNVLFAYLLVGTSITKLDVAGTLTIIQKTMVVNSRHDI